jgi:hypothetical protein
MPVTFRTYPIHAILSGPDPFLVSLRYDRVVRQGEISYTPVICYGQPGHDLYSIPLAPDDLPKIRVMDALEVIERYFHLQPDPPGEIRPRAIRNWVCRLGNDLTIMHVYPQEQDLMFETYTLDDIFTFPLVLPVVPWRRAIIRNLLDRPWFIRRFVEDPASLMQDVLAGKRGTVSLKRAARIDIPQEGETRIFVMPQGLGRFTVRVLDHGHHQRRQGTVHLRGDELLPFFRDAVMGKEGAIHDRLRKLVAGRYHAIAASSPSPHLLAVSAVMHGPRMRLKTDLYDLHHSGKFLALKKRIDLQLEKMSREEILEYHDSLVLSQLL